VRKIHLIVSADIENQINELESSERKNYMEMIGLKETGLSLLIQKGYKILELDTLFHIRSRRNKSMDNTKELYSS
jgi:ribosome-binding ATPase YchF (GTP1/OBG family)